MNERDPNYRSRQFGAGGYDRPRQAGQWQTEPMRQTGGLQQDWDEETTYGDRARERDERSSDSPRAYRETREGGDYRPRHAGHTYDGAYGNRFSSFTSEDYGGRDFYAGRGSMLGGMTPSDMYRSDYSATRWFDSDRDRHSRDYGEWREYGERRGFLERAGDEIASWFGDEDAARRRQMDHEGRGPSDYIRSDERIREDANDYLTRDRNVDATNISVSVSDGEVTLTGTVHDRWAKRRAEDVVDRVSGVKHVQNNLRVTDTGLLGAERSSTGWSSSDFGSTDKTV